MTEDALQRQIVQALTLAGCVVLVTSRRRCRCVCGRWPRGGDGVTRGTPDLLVLNLTWPARLWKGLEVKLPTGRLSPEQRRLVDAGAAVVVRSVAEALAVAGIDHVTVR